jgi:hypothetical protein
MTRYIVSTFLKEFGEKRPKIQIYFKDKYIPCSTYELISINGNPNSFSCTIQYNKVQIQVRVYQVFV